MTLFCSGFSKTISIFAIGCNRCFFGFILVLLHSGCIGEINQQGDSKLLPPVNPIAVDHMILKTEIEPNWNLVTGSLLSLRSPIPSPERKVRDLETIGDGIRSMVFLASPCAPHADLRSLVVGSVPGSRPASLLIDSCACLIGSSLRSARDAHRVE